MNIRSVVAGSLVAISLCGAGALAASAQEQPAAGPSPLSVARADAAQYPDQALPGPEVACEPQLIADNLARAEWSLDLAGALDEAGLEYSLRPDEQEALSVVFSTAQLEAVEARAPELLPPDGTGPDAITEPFSWWVEDGDWTEVDEETRAYHAHRLVRQLAALDQAGIDVSTEARGAVTVISQTDLRRLEVLEVLARVGAEISCADQPPGAWGPSPEVPDEEQAEATGSGSTREDGSGAGTAPETTTPSFSPGPGD